MRAALVSGANRGIGFEICRQLGRHGYRILLGSRDERRGRRACERLAGEGIEAAAVQLDVTDPQSVRQAAERIAGDPGRLDVLVNNAAVAIDPEDTLEGVDLEVFRRTMETNVLGALRLCQAFLPLMRRQGYGRIVNVSSGRGSFSRLAAGAAGGPSYRISKTALNAMTVILADELEETNVLVNAMTPGWVRTRLGGLNAPRSVEEGAKTAVWLAMLPDDGPRGKFFRDREEFPW